MPERNPLAFGIFVSLTPCSSKPEIISISPTKEMRDGRRAEQRNASADGAKNGSDTGVAVKKTRAPRRPKNAVGAAANAESAIADKLAKKTRAKRGSKVSEAKGPKTTRLASTAKPTTSAQTTVVDELADLLTLEEENRSLRKQLADKLRAENADLRKRLG